MQRLPASRVEDLEAFRNKNKKVQGNQSGQTIAGAGKNGSVEENGDDDSESEIGDVKLEPQVARIDDLFDAEEDDEEEEENRAKNGTHKRKSSSHHPKSKKLAK